MVISCQLDSRELTATDALHRDPVTVAGASLSIQPGSLIVLNYTDATHANPAPRAFLLNCNFSFKALSAEV